MVITMTILIVVHLIIMKKFYKLLKYFIPFTNPPTYIYIYIYIYIYEKANVNLPFHNLVEISMGTLTLLNPKEKNILFS
jgi:hypothetical protein